MFAEHARGADGARGARNRRVHSCRVMVSCRLSSSMGMEHGQNEIFTEVRPGRKCNLGGRAYA